MDDKKPEIIKYFTAAWCSKCQMLKPFIEKMNEKYEIEIIDLTESQEMAEKYNVQSIPRMIYGDRELHLPRPEQEIKEFIEECYDL